MWFKICLNYDNGIVDESVMSDYGNNPRHIHNHYVYRNLVRGLISFKYVKELKIIW